MIFFFATEKFDREIKEGRLSGFKYKSSGRNYYVEVDEASASKLIRIVSSYGCAWQSNTPTRTNRR
jgi:hypothetical protein